MRCYADECPPPLDNLRGPRRMCNRRLRGDKFTAAYVADGSTQACWGKQKRSFV